VIAADLVDLIFEVNELPELSFEVLKLGILLVETLQALINLLLPEPVVLLKAVKELLDVVLSTLDRTSEEKDHLDDLLVLCDPVVEGLSLVLRDVLLIPVLHSLSRLENVASSAVNCALDFLKSRLELADVSIKVHIDLEEWLENLLGCVAAATDALLHLVQRVLGGVEESLVHRPVVVLRQLLDLLSRDRFDMLVKLVRANGLD
jgi:hypothetical protein